MPTKIKFVVVVLWIKIISEGVGAVLTVTVGHFSDDEDVNTAMMLIVGYLALAATVLLAVCTILVRRRFRWVRKTLIALQMLTALFVLVVLLQGGPYGIGAILLSTFVIYGLLSPEGREWFTR